MTANEGRPPSRALTIKLVIESILNQIDSQNLLQCRLVSPQWNQVAVPILRQRADIPIQIVDRPIRNRPRSPSIPLLARPDKDLKLKDLTLVLPRQPPCVNYAFKCDLGHPHFQQFIVLHGLHVKVLELDLKICENSLDLFLKLLEQAKNVSVLKIQSFPTSWTYFPARLPKLKELWFDSGFSDVPTRFLEDLLNSALNLKILKGEFVILSQAEIILEAGKDHVVKEFIFDPYGEFLPFLQNSINSICQFTAIQDLTLAFGEDYDDHVIEMLSRILESVKVSLQILRFATSFQGFPPSSWWKSKSKGRFQNYGRPHFPPCLSLAPLRNLQTVCFESKLYSWSKSEKARGFFEFEKIESVRTLEIQGHLPVDILIKLARAFPNCLHFIGQNIEHCFTNVPATIRQHFKFVKCVEFTFILNPPPMRGNMERVKSEEFIENVLELIEPICQDKKIWTGNVSEQLNVLKVGIGEWQKPMIDWSWRWSQGGVAMESEFISPGGGLVNQEDVDDILGALKRKPCLNN